MQPQQFSLYGAADLGARQTAAQRRQQQAARPGDDATPADGASAAVFDTGDETFTVDVVERSRSVPVILDLWAEWCGPCKQLSPVLEKLATEAAGQWVLAKVDVDANPQLSAALRVQSIPMVVAVIGGQMVDGFLGALPEAQTSTAPPPRSSRCWPPRPATPWPSSAWPRSTCCAGWAPTTRPRPAGTRPSTPTTWPRRPGSPTSTWPWATSTRPSTGCSARSSAPQVRSATRPGST